MVPNSPKVELSEAYGGGDGDAETLSGLFCTMSPSAFGEK